MNSPGPACADHSAGFRASDKGAPRSSRPSAHGPHERIWAPLRDAQRGDRVGSAERISALHAPGARPSRVICVGRVRASTPDLKFVPGSSTSVAEPQRRRGLAERMSRFGRFVASALHCQSRESACSAKIWHAMQVAMEHADRGASFRQGIRPTARFPAHVAAPAGGTIRGSVPARAVRRLEAVAAS